MAKIAFYIVFLLVVSCKSTSASRVLDDDQTNPDNPEGSAPVVASVSPNAIEIMSYNVENLFDAQHDPEKEDWEFTPADTPGKPEFCESIRSENQRQRCVESDWTQDKLDLKFAQIKSIVVRADGSKPDVLGLVEVENRAVVEQLAAVLGYEGIVVTESLDKRGLDVAILFVPSQKLAFGKTTIHRPVDERFRQYPTRDMLEVEFRVNGNYRLSVVVNHWPAQRTSPKARLALANQLHELLKSRLSQDPQHHLVYLGDFNTTPLDDPHPFRLTWLRKGEESRMFDVHERFMGSRNVTPQQKINMAPGSTFYPPAMTWSLLDRIFVSTNLRDSRRLDVDIPTYQIYTPATHKTDFVFAEGSYLAGSRIVGTPKRYDFKAVNATDAGHSDHFPLLVRLKF